MDISIKTISQNGAHRRVSKEDLTEYETLAPELIHEWTFTTKPLTAGDVGAADRALNADKTLYRDGGQGNQEAIIIARSTQILLKCLTAWNFKSGTGDALPITKENIETLPVDILISAAGEAEFPKVPTLEELRLAKKG
jgi:hypothetical protein